MWLKYKSALLSEALFRYDHQQLDTTRLTKPCLNPDTIASSPLHLHILSLSGLIASSLSDLGKQIKQQTDKEEGGRGKNREGRESKDE